VLRVACVCYPLWQLTREAVPGLRLKLYPHQVRGVDNGKLECQCV
jgi:hypothetical protein